MAGIADLVMQSAQDAGVDPRLALSLAVQESGLDPNARGRAGEIGVMQLEPATAAQLGVDPSDVTQNIRGGVAYLKQQLDRFGSVPAALAAYNCGPACVARAIAQWGGAWLAHVPPLTQAYVSSILGRVASAYTVSVQPSAILETLTSPATTPALDTAGLLALAGIGLGIYLLADFFS